ncbi:alpha/beta hydrolase [Amycolatopsis sp. OK19-0408]|uniref:Alpha/beta hydrolase n=1 Tax=Amycolatopsis iheyensis TaxID=2945988 RepID=A0A9X2SHY8_9PSEU|nr:alpha/beta hydrolase [Amycolatopsis iheyensis]MCR6483232.1 alpha/beta hydrolase [Amycolatopsis iheyensis]
MTEYVLVAGAWLGAWAWDDVVGELSTAGHGVHPVTLSGVAERAGEPGGQQAHVQDIVDVVERADLRDVVVVGHSYSGIPVGQAAERIGSRLRRVVFVDSNVPSNGESFTSRWSAERVAELTESGYWPPLTAEDYAGQGLSADQITRIVDGSTPHPAASLTEPAVLAGSLAELPATYLKCLLDGDTPSPDVVALLESDRWELVELNTGHWPMFSQPAELARVLLAAG